MIPRLKLGRPGLAFRTSFTLREEFIGTTTAFELRKRFCLMGMFQRTPEDVSYLAFVWDPIREAWDEAPFPVPPVLALRGDSIDNHLFVSGHVDSSDPTGPISTTRPLRAETGQPRLGRVEHPRRTRQMATQIAAVRLGHRATR